MAHLLKNLSNIPFDVPALDGPKILPAYGEITAELSAYEVEVMRHSLMVEIVDAGEAAAEPDIDDLRKQYAELVGKPPDKRWGVPRLQSEIDKALAA